jgi:signal transduction histidine kinase
MIDFNEIPQAQILARGQYSIVRSKREDALKELRTLCEGQNSATAAILRDIQDGHEVTRHFAFLRQGLGSMTELIAELEDLTEQLNLIRPEAFPK